MKREPTRGYRCTCIAFGPILPIALGIGLYCLPPVSCHAERVTYTITPDYQEVWEDGRRVEIIRHYRANGRKVATRDREGLKFHFSDHLGSAGRLADVRGNEVKAVAYTPYGSDAAQTGPATVRYKYNDKEHDHTGLYYYGARYHDSDVGRFMSADALLPDIHDPQQLNRYTYVRNNPVKLVDPDGHRAVIFAYDRDGVFRVAGQSIEGAYGMLDESLLELSQAYVSYLADLYRAFFPRSKPLLGPIHGGSDMFDMRKIKFSSIAKRSDEDYTAVAKYRDQEVAIGFVDDDGSAWTVVRDLKKFKLPKGEGVGTGIVRGLIAELEKQHQVNQYRSIWLADSQAYKAFMAKVGTSKSKQARVDAARDSFILQAVEGAGFDTIEHVLITPGEINVLVSKTGRGDGHAEVDDRLIGGPLED